MNKVPPMWELSGFIGAIGSGAPEKVVLSQVGENPA